MNEHTAKYVPQPAAGRLVQSGRARTAHILRYYAPFCLLQLLALPFLVLRWGWNFARGRHRGNLLSRLAGGPAPPHPARWLIVVGTALGEARTALRAAEKLRLSRRADVAVWLELDEVYATLNSTTRGFPVSLSPFKNPLSVGLALRNWHPAAIVFVESVRNPHLAAIAGLLGIPTMVANANISEERTRRYERRPLGGWRYAVMDHLVAQAETHRRRLARLGVPPERITVQGPAALDAVPEDVLRARREKWSGLLGLDLGPRPIVVAGSTHPGEEEEILEAFVRLREQVPRALLVFAPRHCRRRGGADSSLRTKGLAFTRRSSLPGPAPPEDIVLLDTQGELGELYASASVAFMGGSLIPRVGGHTPLEAIASGVPITVGPHFSQQEAPVTSGTEHGIVTVCKSAEELAREWHRCIGDGDHRDLVRSRCEAYAERHGGAFEAWHDLLLGGPTAALVH